MLEAAIRVPRGELVVDVDLACKPGITCIMGPSGSGKSTVLGAIAGLIAPQRGKVVLDGETWLDTERGLSVPVHRRQLSYMFQSLALFPHMTARGNVEYGIHGVPRAERTERALALLARVGVSHLAHRRPSSFSGGEAQRVALARAIAHRPRLLLLDEPFSALDRDLRAQVVALVRDLVAELGVPLLHVTHSVNEARQLADQVLVIEKGKIVRIGPPGEVLIDAVD